MIRKLQTNISTHLSDVSSTKASKIVYEITKRSKVRKNIQSQIFFEAVCSLPKDVLTHDYGKEDTLKR